MDIDAWARLVSALAGLLAVLVPLYRARPVAPGWPSQPPAAGSGAHPGEMLCYAYCPSCSTRVGTEVAEPRAEWHAQDHATITGHVVQLVDADTHVTLRSIAGEPSLPLWGKTN